MITSGQGCGLQTFCLVRCFSGPLIAVISKQFVPFLQNSFGIRGNADPTNKDTLEFALPRHFISAKHSDRCEDSTRSHKAKGTEKDWLSFLCY